MRLGDAGRPVIPPAAPWPRTSEAFDSKNRSSLPNWAGTAGWGSDAARLQAAPLAKAAVYACALAPSNGPGAPTAAPSLSDLLDHHNSPLPASLLMALASNDAGSAGGGSAEQRRGRLSSTSGVGGIAGMAPELFGGAPLVADTINCTSRSVARVAALANAHSLRRETRTYAYRSLVCSPHSAHARQHGIHVACRGAPTH